MEIKATSFIADPNNIAGDELTLQGKEAHHLVGVMRAKRGDIFYAIDGQGKRYRSSIAEITKSEVVAQIISVTRNENEPLTQITLGLPMLKGPAMAFALEKGTECGVSRFIPYTSENCIVSIGDEQSLRRKKTRWQSVVRAAVKQSLRSRIPPIENPLPLSDLLNSPDDFDMKIAADMGEGSRPLNSVRFPEGSLRIFLLVGPEAGFTVAEREDAKEAGLKGIRFGPRRLRAETAAAVLPLILQSAIGELS